MRRIALLFVVVFSCLLIHAQDSTSSIEKINKHNINIELGGTGLLYSVGYERNIFIKKTSYQSIKTGISYQPFYSVDQIFIPIDYNLYYGKGKTKLLLGAGFIGLIGTNPSPSSAAARQDFKNMYNADPASAISKYGTDRYEKPFDLAYTAKIGFVCVGKKINFYMYYNCFYIRFNMNYVFQPVWLGTGLSFKI